MKSGNSGDKKLIEKELFDTDLALKEEIEDMFNTRSESEEIDSLINENIVSGIYANEIQLEQLYSCKDWSTSEIEENLDDYFRFFSKIDMDLIYMYFIGDKTQVDLQNIFDKTQPAISCTVDRIHRQIGTIIKIQGMMDEFVDFISDPNNKLSYRDRDILLILFYSTSIAKTSQIIGISTMVCRARIADALKTVKETGHQKIYEYFLFIMENLNKVKKGVSDDAIIDKPGRFDYPSGHVSQELPFEMLDREIGVPVPVIEEEKEEEI